MTFSIAQRLRASSAFFFGLVLAVAVAALWQMGAMRDEARAITAVWLPSVELVNQMNTSSGDFRAGEFRHVLSTDPMAMAEVEKSMAAVLAEFDRDDAAFAALIVGDDERRLYDDFKRDWTRYLAVHGKVIALSRQNLNDDARQLLETEGMRYFDTSSDTLDRLIALNHQRAVDATTRSSDAFTTARSVLAVTVGLALVVAALGSWRLIRSITAPLARAARATERVAAGDLGTPIGACAQDETGRLLRSLSTMQASLVVTVGAVRAASARVATGSSGIAAGNVELGRRTETQAANVEQTAASMEELAATVQANAETAGTAARIAEAASATASSGGDAVREVVATMQAITGASRRIGDIIGVIDGIAFQTRLLALNAAVEAARAGDQGRGFAVVAGEVGGLAQRATAAAAEVKSLITDSAEKVDAGSRQVEVAGRTMAALVGQVQQVSEMIGQISVATREQTEGIVQVSAAVTELDRATQQNASLVEQSSAATADLGRQAAELVEAVAFFRFAESAEPAG